MGDTPQTIKFQARARDRATLANRAAQRHQWMLQVDDLIEPRPEQILLSRFPSFVEGHPSRQNSTDTNEFR